MLAMYINAFTFRLTPNINQRLKVTTEPHPPSTSIATSAENYRDSLKEEIHQTGILLLSLGKLGSLMLILVRKTPLLVQALAIGSRISH